MLRVLLLQEARAEFDALPLVIQARVRDVFVRLEQWPNVLAQSPCAMRCGDTTAFVWATIEWSFVLSHRT